MAYLVMKISIVSLKHLGGVFVVVMNMEFLVCVLH